MMPAMNERNEVATTRDATLNTKVSESNNWVLMSLSICSGFIVGNGSKDENVKYIVGSNLLS